jgi:integrase
MAKPKPTRAKKPRPDFPLFPHATGRWAKKIRGKFHYFGKVAGDEKGQAALAKWLEQRDDLLAGRTPRPKADGLTIRDLCNRFLSAKKALLDNAELSPHTFNDAYLTCQRVGACFGWDRLVVDLAAADFDHLRRQSAKACGPVRLGVEIGRVRGLFRFANDSGLIDQPVRYGANFRGPSRRVLRVERAGKGPRMFEPAELRAIIGAAPMPLKVMVLLGVNCGFGNSDIANLPTKALDLQAGWVRFPRPKTGIDRRCPLWPETVAALREAIASRPSTDKREYQRLAFLTSKGQSWGRTTHEDASDGKVKLRHRDFVGRGFEALLDDLGLHRDRLGFYTLRHVFETVAGDSRDQVAVDAIMGHSRNDMASAYRERIDDARLVAVTEHVRKWLFGEEEAE